VKKDCVALFSEYLLCKELWSCPPSLLAEQDYKKGQEHLILFDELKKREDKEMKEAERNARRR
jgi:hypothetical protein